MRKIKKIICSVIAFIFVFSYFTQSMAATPYIRLGTGKISGGATGILYYIDSSATEYKDSIGNGIEYWNGYTSKVQVLKTTVKSYSRCDNYWGDYFYTSSILAETELYLNNEITNNYNKDWYWCKIKYNSRSYKYEDEGGISYAQRKATACHEYGHFLGLAHTNDNPTNIMCQLGYGRIATVPSRKGDRVGIIAIYGS